MRIKALSSHIANQIAAGEVIERPASVVKELLENALDAGATALTIEIGFGGLNLIKVSDNGHGIYADDLPLAIAAHATSKISQLDDLYAITTMGFRGEALASIASVSRMNLYSKPADQVHGMRLHVDETGVQIEPFARTQGTTVEICDLFFNTPVRKTFLKSERLEYQAIELVVKQFALSAPELALTFFHNQKQILSLPSALCAQSRLLRIKKLFGQAFLNDAIAIHTEHNDFLLQGWISQHQYQRSQRDRQWVYLNHRLIKDKLILQAIGQAYQDILHPGRYASCILYLTVPPDQVDVNVHPTKHEVRFRQPRLIHAMIVSSLANQVCIPETPRELEHKPDDRMNTQAHINDLFPPQSSSNPTWKILNPRFAILQLPQATPYLVDIVHVYQHSVASLVETLPTPWPHRALLVPVQLDIGTSADTWFEHHREILLALGIQFDLITATHVWIRTIPLHLPLLDLDTFFMSIQKTNWNQNDLMKHIIACQKFDAYNMSPIERDTLCDYCMKNIDTMNAIQACLPLDVHTCTQIMRHTVSR